MLIRTLLALGTALVATAPAFADTVQLTEQTRSTSLSRQMSDADRAAYRQIAAALRAKDWAAAASGLDALPNGLLTPVFRAELYAAKGAPQADTAALTALLAAMPDLPQCLALAKLAIAQGATGLPALAIQHDLVRVAGASKRTMVRATRSDAVAQKLATQVQPLLKANDPATAEPLVEMAASQLTPEAQSEWRARLAWAYFQTGDDTSARRLAEIAKEGAGDWAVQAAWVDGLAAWRQADYATAGAAFDRVAARGLDSETIAAGYFWAARSATAGGKPDQVAYRLRSAARYGETFYGLLASASLGTSPAAPLLDPAFTASEGLLRHNNIRAAAALVEIGETALADQLIRQQARIGSASEHEALIAFAGRMGLPATQLWLAQNAPAGAQTSPMARYPMPAWAPSGGWRVDRSLLYAHALQESQFRIDAVSRTGARGLMQLMPGTAKLVARHRGDPMDMADRMTDPALNFEYGQSYLEELANNAGTGGLLPKVIAAYNAGPNNVALWNLKTNVQQDPLLFIEAIPFAETRAYVAIVMRNYWMYQRQVGDSTTSLTALAQGQWPRFPERAGATASRGSAGAMAPAVVGN
jgi:soluble lytic murein transglycosylase-like protein